MGLVLTGAPAAEPVLLEEAKAHLKIDHDDEDVMLASLMLAARLQIEQALSLGLITQAWTYQMDGWPKGAIVNLPLSPLQAVTAVRVKNSSGASELIAGTNYVVDLVSKPPRLVWNGNAGPQAPGIVAGGIEIDLTVGFGASGASVPAPIKHAILMLTAHWYEHRDLYTGDAQCARIPAAINDLIQPFRTMRL